MERRRSATEELEQLSIVEEIYEQVCEEFEKEEKTARSENHRKKHVKSAEISKITDPAYLINLLDEDNDPGRIEVND